MHSYRFAAAVLLCAPLPAVAADDATTQALKTIKSVSREGQGNDAAAAAWKSVVHGGMSSLIPTLEAMKGADATAANWLRTAVDAIAEGEKTAGRKLPADKLEAFVKDTTQDPAARRIAYELITKDDPQASNRLLSGFLDDPSLELRRDAVASALKQAEGQREQLRKLFQSARDKNQVEEISKALAKLGEKPSVSEHFGYVTHWNLIGPFDSTESKGFNVTYPPEAKVDLHGTLKGKGDVMLAWKPFVTTDRYATVDLNKGLEKHKDSVGYAFSTIVSATEQPVEVRLASQNAVKVFLNGKPIFAREEYHHGTRMDQHVARGTLKAGKNELLVKVCQNNMDQNWAQAWAVQCRLCDATGGALPVQQLAGTKPVKLGLTPQPDADPKEKK